VPYMHRRIYTDPNLPMVAYTALVSLLDEASPGCVGQLNHNEVFVRPFGRAMASHLSFCVAAQHWVKIPALGIPSDFARVLDGYTCEGETLQILVHVITTEHGDVEWLLVDIIPNVMYSSLASHNSRSKPQSVMDIVVARGVGGVRASPAGPGDVIGRVSPDRGVRRQGWPGGRWPGRVWMWLHVIGMMCPVRGGDRRWQGTGQR
jgi:hypothetical protein